jgi:hypothetical protein
VELGRDSEPLVHGRHSAREQVGGRRAGGLAELSAAGKQLVSLCSSPYKRSSSESGQYELRKLSELLWKEYLQSVESHFFIMTVALMTVSSLGSSRFLTGRLSSLRPKLGEVVDVAGMNFLHRGVDTIVGC